VQKPIISEIRRDRVLPSGYDRVATQLYVFPERSLRSVINITYRGLTSGDEFRVVLSFFFLLLKFAVFMLFVKEPFFLLMYKIDLTNYVKKLKKEIVFCLNNSFDKVSGKIFVVIFKYANEFITCSICPSWKIFF